MRSQIKIVDKQDPKSRDACLENDKAPLGALRNSEYGGALSRDAKVRTQSKRHGAIRGVDENEANIAGAYGSAHVLLIASNVFKQASIRKLLNTYGCRCLAVSTFDEALEMVDSPYGVGVVIIEPGGFEEALCQGVSSLRKKADHLVPVVLLGASLSFEALGEIARTGPVDVLPEAAGDNEFIASVQQALQLFEPARPSGGAQNNVLDMLAQIEARLSDLTIEPSGGVNQRLVTPKADDGAHVRRRQADIDCEMVKRIMSFRSIQEEILGTGLIDDAAWVMLLDLLLMHFKRKKLAVTALYIGSGAPIATALRRLNQLIERGLVVKTPDPADRRRFLVEITPKGIEGVCFVLNYMQNAFFATADH